MDPRQIALLGIAIIVPCTLFLMGRTRLLLGWVCITLFVQIFDSNVNFVPGRIVGFLYMPYALLTARHWLRLLPVKAWAWGFLYLLILGIAFGFIWPWPDTTGSRALPLTPQGRTIIYLLRMMSTASLAVFIANELRKPGTLLYLGKMMVVGTSLTASFGVISFATNFDFFTLITGMERAAIISTSRARGLSIEPRILGGACVYGIMILLLLRQRKLSMTWSSLRWLGLILIHLASLLLTASTSALALFLMGLFVGGLFLSGRVRSLVAGVAALSVLGVVLFQVLMPDRFAFALREIHSRVQPEETRLGGVAPTNIGQAVAFQMDIFDACAALFLYDQPLYAVVGTGPGLVTLPGSNYVPPGRYSAIWSPDVGINSPPTSGLLLEISNGGIIALALWIVQVIACHSALRLLATNQVPTDDPEGWRFAHAFFLMGSAFYLMQVGFSPRAAVLLGIGWAASRIVAERRQQAHRVDSPVARTVRAELVARGAS